MIRNSFPSTIQVTVCRCLIRSFPNKTRIATLPLVEDVASRRMSVIVPSSISTCGNAIHTTPSSWTPPELKFTPKEQTVALQVTKQQQQQQQTRNLVWHAGYLEQAQVQELETTIRSQMDTLVDLIQKLPNNNGSGSSHASSASSSSYPCNPNMVEQILQQEELILKSCQEYKLLTGEDFDALPPPYCDESSTVLPMMAMA